MSDNDEWDVDNTDFTDYDGEVISAMFEVNEYTNKPEIHLTLMTDNAEVPSWNERYSLGTTKNGGTWIIVDDGDGVEATDGAVRFRDNSNYGKFITAARKLAEKELVGRGSPRSTAVWLGTKWHFAQTSGSFKNRETGEQVTWTRNFPSAFLGIVESGNGQVPKAEDVQVVAEPDTSTFDQILQELTPDVLSRMITVAKESPDFSTFLDDVLEAIPELLGYGNVRKVLGKPEFYTSLRK